MKKVTIKKNKTVGYGYVGLWQDRTLGWTMPDHLSGPKDYADKPYNKGWNRGARVYKCRITVELIKAKNGRLITKIIK